MMVPDKDSKPDEDPARGTLLIHSKKCSIKVDLKSCCLCCTMLRLSNIFIFLDICLLELDVIIIKICFSLSTFRKFLWENDILSE